MNTNKIKRSTVAVVRTDRDEHEQSYNLRRAGRLEFTKHCDVTHASNVAADVLRRDGAVIVKFPNPERLAAFRDCFWVAVDAIPFAFRELEVQP